MDIWLIGTLNMSISYINRKSICSSFLFLIFTLTCFLFGCSSISSQPSEEISEEIDTEKTEMSENSIESWESCRLILETSYGLDEWIKCRTRIPEREFMEEFGTIIDPIEIDGKYHYTFEMLGIEMIVDYPFSEHIYVMETELPRESGVEGMIYAYENTGTSVYWESCFWLNLLNYPELSEDEKMWYFPITQLNEETYLVSRNTLSYAGTENMMNLLNENLVTYEKLDEFLEHTELRLLAP